MNFKCRLAATSALVAIAISTSPLQAGTYVFNDSSDNSQTHSIDGRSVTISVDSTASFSYSSVTLSNHDSGTVLYDYTINSPKGHVYTVVVDGTSYTVNLQNLSSDDPLTGIVDITGFVDSAAAVQTDTQENAQTVVTNANKAVSKSVSSRIAAITKLLRNPNARAKLAKGEIIQGEFSTITGLSSGDGVQSFGVWVTPTVNSYETDYSGQNKIDGRALSVSAGFDTILTDRLIVGGAFTFSDDTAKEKGGSSTITDSQSYTVTAYGGYLLNDFLSFEGYASYAVDKFDIERNNLGGLVQSDYDGSHWAVGFGATASTMVSSYILEGKAGVSHSSGETDAYTLNTTNVNRTDSRVTTVSIGAEVARPFDNGIEPYFGLQGEKDTSYSGVKKDDAGGYVNAGLRWTDEDYNLSASLDLSEQIGRSDAESTLVSVNFRLNF